MAVVGSTISHYRIIRKLGEGGMGVVYEAEDLRLGRRVALKFLSPHRIAHGDSRERFLREARAAAALKHPNICTVYDVDEAEGQLFIAMEYCEGSPLVDLTRRGPMDLAAVISIIGQVAAALAEAHSRQVIHRDVKSSNIIVNGKNHAWLLDFGLASPQRPSDDTLTIEFLGTPAYMAPERFALQLNDVRGDIWGVGVVLFEALTGRMPFTGQQSDMVRAILHHDPPPLSSVRAGLPIELEDIVGKALAKDPADRYQTAQDLARDLSSILRTSPPEPRDFISTVTGTVHPEYGSRGLSIEPEALRTVAVLPFVDLSHNPEDEFLGDGLSEEITTALTQVHGLRVVSRASTYQFKSPSLDLRDVGRRLRVGALVLGSVRRQGERVRVTAQLVKAADGYQLWSQRFDCEMKSVFEVEDQLTQAIVEQLRKWLGVDLKVGRLRGGTSDFTAHEVYLRGRYSFNLQTQVGVAEALQCFSQALKLAPGYALAHVGIADCYALQGWYGMEPAKVVMPKAKMELEAAIAIEGALPPAWCLLAAISAGFDWNWELARTQFETAFALGPSTSDLHFHHALDFLAPLGHLNESLMEMRLAVELDPAAPLLGTAVGGCLLRLRRYPAALRQLESTLELAPDFYHARWTLGRVHEAQGAFAPALDCFERALAGSGNNPAVLADLGHCRGAMGDRDAADQILKQVAGRPLQAAIVCLGLGENGRAIEHLKEAMEERARGLIWLGVDARFDALRHERGFCDVLAAVGVADRRT